MSTRRARIIRLMLTITDLVGILQWGAIGLLTIAYVMGSVPNALH